ncbi:MotA/TolQ/ExbB proton channel family protein [Hydrogenophilus thermoluteolus]|uniref:MotA/TolQ/ExbB proton channel family protein n=1 Tax=Hydrogenophilus thiooxidans TaxID=2820326 RepID=UPI001C2368CF|nr:MULTISPECIES: MotA/TolQ/ExbB proton channel family protein [Hydrogenophilus]MBW7657663.1 MotA/TolQ/ExbB proton channel family protein [Hydrogenophilus thermoluteolus]HNQ49604.1 MotA/TolQ/ExbB proton channel family protein [Hydrogenophilus thermoluteolus]HNU19613.1 MotA/TolQ/ExbB proton channel family protein [Hydrogenophilus thermoluteolus]
MSQMLEIVMYQTAQVFLIPTLVAIAVMFIYAFYALGAFAVQWWQRRKTAISFDAPRGFPLVAWARGRSAISDDDLDVMAHKLLELPRMVTRVAPMLGLVATMIPLGPALKGLSDGNLAQVSDNLTVAFSAVILALIAAAITYWIVSVKRRWLAEELVWLMAHNRRPPVGKVADSKIADEVEAGAIA